MRLPSRFCYSIVDNVVSLIAPLDWYVEGTFKYLATSTTMTFEEAEDFCGDVGATIASASDETNKLFIDSLTSGTPWAGLKNNSDGTAWEWIDGSSSAGYLSANEPPTPVAGICNTFDTGFVQVSCDTPQTVVCKTRKYSRSLHY